MSPLAWGSKYDDGPEVLAAPRALYPAEAGKYESRGDEGSAPLFNAADVVEEEDPELLLLLLLPALPALLPLGLELESDETTKYIG